MNFGYSGLGQNKQIFVLTIFKYIQDLVEYYHGIYINQNQLNSRHVSDF